MAAAKSKRTNTKKIKRLTPKAKGAKINKKEPGGIGGIYKKVSYSTGFICAKVSKVKKIADKKAWDKPLSEMNALLHKATETTASLLEKAKESAGDLKESFIAGYEAKEAQSGPKKKKAKNTQEPEDALVPDNQHIAKEAQEAPNDTLEKEIERIDNSVPEV